MSNIFAWPAWEVQETLHALRSDAAKSDSSNGASTPAFRSASRQACTPSWEPNDCGRSQTEPHDPPRLTPRRRTRCTPPGANGPGRVPCSTASRHSHRHPSARDPRAPDERAAKGLFLALQYPFEIPGVATMTFPAHRAQCAAQAARGEPDIAARLPQAACARSRRQARHRAGHAARAASMSASPAARRSATRFCRWRCCSRGWPCSTRPIPVSTSMRSRSCPKASTGCARPSGRSS